MSTIASNPFGGSANTLESRVTPTPAQDATEGDNLDSAAYEYELRVVAQN